MDNITPYPNLSEYMINKVAAIVVTYNRKELLAENLEALLDQSYKIEKIFVVDNKSTDGTIEFLEMKGLKNNSSIKILELDENLGGAGGFYHGLENALDGGYDWYWLMDDDCLPEHTCLEALLNSEKGDYLTPLVLSREDKTACVWHDAKPGTGLTEMKSIPFNGALISKRVVKDIGLPKKEFFIFCDDVEYSLRAKKNNYRLYLNTDAILYHPVNNSQIISAFFNKFKIPVFKTRIKQYCYIRNNIYIAKRYREHSSFYKDLVKQIYYAIFIDRKMFKTVFSAICHGITDNFGQTSKFLK